MQTDSYCVKVPGFEGPFDLLYHLVAREEVDIWEISIAHIVDQYIQYLSLIQEQSQISMAGDFLVMAASLLQLKSRLLLPRLPVAPREREEEAFYFGSKEDLVRSLLAYRRFKIMAGELQRRERSQQGIYVRTSQGEKVITVNMQSSLFPHSPDSLVNALKGIREKETQEKERNINLPEKLSFRNVMRKILTALRKAGNADRYLDEFIYGKSKRELVISIFAFLELARRGKLKLRQEKLFERIRITFPFSKNKL